MKDRFIKFPDAAEIVDTKTIFNRIAIFPGVIGAIDCTHIPIVSPGGLNAARFVNREGYYSVNTQLVCDANMKVTNIVARWPGATHDNRTFLNSRLCILLENNPNLSKAENNPNLSKAVCFEIMVMLAVSSC